MGKFKVGDYVNGAVVIEVEPDDYDGILNTRIRFGDGRDAWVNSENYQLVHFDQPIVSSLEEIKPEESIQKVKKFKVGDHVKGTNRSSYAITNENLIDSEVMELSDEGDNWIRIKCIRFLDGDAKEIGESFCVDPNDFDYADGYSSVSGTVSSFVVNGQEYTKEQYEKDCKRFLEAFPDEKSFDLSYAMENILNVYQWAQRNPVVTNLDHYAEEFGWTEEQKKYVLEHCPFPFMGIESKFCPKQSSGITILCGECRKWWDQEWKGGKA